jgi:hypothetical protein
MSNLRFEFRKSRRESWFDPMNKNDVYVELNETVDRIEVHFRFDADDVAAVKTVKGRRYNPEERFWTVPMEMVKARQLREIFGERMQLGPAVRAWAKEQVKLERNMRQLNAATDAKLERTPKIILDVIAGRKIEHPTIPVNHVLRRKREPRPYQRADIKLMSLANAGNFNDVGTGKTLEAIGALYEGEIAPKPVLIVAPRRSLVNVWETEFHRLSDYSLWTSENPRERSKMMQTFTTSAHDNLAIALIADDIRIEKYHDVKQMPPDQKDPLHACVDYKGNWYRFRSAAQMAFFQIEAGAEPRAPSGRSAASERAQRKPSGTTTGCTWCAGPRRMRSLASRTPLRFWSIRR